eukprot:3214739-Prymnesium_polylepis.1
MLKVDPTPDAFTARMAYADSWDFKPKGPRADFSFRAMLTEVEELAIVKVIDRAAASGFPIRKRCAAACLPTAAAS